MMAAIDPAAEVRRLFGAPPAPPRIAPVAAPPRPAMPTPAPAPAFAATKPPSLAKAAPHADINRLLGVRPKPVPARTAAGPQGAAMKALDVIFADALGDTYDPPDEIVEGILTAGGASVWYGDSNSGKTFLIIGMGCAASLGALWMGLRTEPGLVIYLAAESPASACSRLQTYQSHHGVRVPNFAIVRSPIDLFDSDADTDLLILTIRQIETERGQRVRLIIGDTLARLSAGANENSGQDMGLIVRRIDRIRAETGAHFALIHHSGKIAANGARGWSGLRAAIDTEVEVTDSPTGRCAEITKQRDLPTKGKRIGFRLDVVELGLTKWGTPATSCVVQPADAPAKTTGKRISEIGGAVVEFLRNRGTGCRKKVLVEHFDGRYTSSAVYREVKHLVEAGQLLEVAGVVGLSGEVPKGAD